MHYHEWDFTSRPEQNDDEFPWERPPEELEDRFGIRIALLVLFVAFFIAALWLVSNPSFEKCSAIENVATRNSCYDGLRKVLLKPPAKGPDIPSG
jgi:hypothetical protein